MNKKNGATDKSKKQHYLPKGILRNFSIEDQVLVYDKKRKKEWPGNIGCTGAENHYNTVVINGIKNNYEYIYGVFDDKAAKVINKIISDKGLTKLSSEEYTFLYYLIIIQSRRTPLFRSSVKSFGLEIKEILKNNFNIDITLNDDTNSIKLASLDIQHDKVLSFYDEIKNKKFYTLWDEKNRFITSDSAVVHETTVAYEVSSPSAFYSIIFFPLSSSCVLALCNEEPLSRVIYNNCRLGSSDEKIISDKLVLAINQLQIIHSHNQIYSRNSVISYCQENNIAYDKIPPKNTHVSFGGKQQNPNIHSGKLLVVCINNLYYEFVYSDFEDITPFLHKIRVLPNKDLDTINNQLASTLDFYDNNEKVSFMRNVKLKIEKTEETEIILLANLA